MEQLKKSIKSGKIPNVKAVLDRLLSEGRQAQELIDGMIDSVRQVGDAFSKGEAFIPEMLIAARAMQAGADHLSDLLAKEGAVKAGKFMIGTVAGDLHDVGKNLVALVFRGNGFEVTDLGVDLATGKLLAAYEAERPDIVGLSALLTTTTPAMEDAVKALKAAHPEVLVMVGGAPVTREFAEQIGADAFAPDAAAAVDTARRLLNEHR